MNPDLFWWAGRARHLIFGPNPKFSAANPRYGAGRATFKACDNTCAVACTTGITRS